MTALRIGVVGVNYAEVTHLPAYRTLAAEGLVELVALATAHPGTAREAAARHGVPRAHVGYEELCVDPEVDLVDIVTRPSLHLDMARSALAAGKRVLCEAPLAPTVAAGEELATLACGRGFVDMQSRFQPGLAELRRRVRDGYVGRVDNVAVTAFYPTFTTEAAVAGSGWCAEAAHGASSLRVHGLHTADLLRWTFGELSDVRGSATTRQPAWLGRVPADSVDSAAWTARTAEGAVCSVHTSWVAPLGAGFRMVVHGSEGVLRAEADGHTGHFPVRLAGARSGDGAVRDLVPASGGPASAFEALARALAAGDTAHVPTFDDGLAALRVASAVEDGDTA
ncbi:Predicted dehydrogenase [Pseudonocardia ammonioxydans]|uniref:Predicted dehydrogenase n=1 Tax=Pseudonocardia ammonioxydans TaxID=260086 RepID=A0A1I4ZWW4_PSUAM|nr:Gfo/Idh/MocA family oxidoreductase [Pseudonocardia ammonioxydans]SFN54489.1 Predicted dehydrogenase [Pseudonocardia ammonioxydans]